MNRAAGTKRADAPRRPGGRPESDPSTAATGGLRFRELDSTAAGLAELARFYRRAYVDEFPDPDERESLANMRRYLRLKADGWYGANNYHVLIAEQEGEPVGGCICDYLAVPNAGVLEFIFIGARFRRRGLGKALLDQTVAILEADAATRRGSPLNAIVAEMNDPFRPPATPDNLDPFHRCLLWGKWGYSKIRFPYVQPALSRRQEAVEGLVLITKWLGALPARDYDAAWVLSVVGEYMRWAMRIEHPERNPQYREMARYLGGRPRVPLIPLQTYVGRDPGRPFRVEELDGRHASFRQAVELPHRAIPHSGRVASEGEFKRALAMRRGSGSRYHLWAIHGSPSIGTEGMVSFYALRPAGFGGYIVLTGELRGRGLLRDLVARIEEQMIRDRVGARGWFIECGPESVAPFRRVGFEEVCVDYRPPAVGARRQGKDVERLHLLYKPFGDAYGPPVVARRFVLDSIAAILKEIYRTSAPRRHHCYLRARESLATTEGGTVAFVPGDQAPR